MPRSKPLVKLSPDEARLFRRLSVALRLRLAEHLTFSPLDVCDDARGKHWASKRADPPAGWKTSAKGRGKHWAAKRKAVRVKPSAPPTPPRKSRKGRDWVDNDGSDRP